MLLYLVAIWIVSLSKIIHVTCFLVQDSYNIDLDDRSNYKIEESVNEDDYEMINREQLSRFSIIDKENKLYELNKLASKEYDNSMNSKGPAREWFRGIKPTMPIVTDSDEEIVTELIRPATHYHLRKRDAIRNDDSEYYNYDPLMNEYYEESVEDAKSNKTFHATTAGNPEVGFVHSAEKIVNFNTTTRNCTAEEINHIGLKAVDCIYKDYKTGETSPKILARRLLRIALIWFYAYLAVAIPLWCTRGWCCCCLFCDFFKPRRTIDEAKRYLIANPPGILRGNKGAETQYPPTEYEIESHDQFEHLIRTI